MPSTTADTTPWPSVPDGARLADLAERRAWLGRIEVAYALPANGWLWWPATSDGVVLTCDGDQFALVPVSDPDLARSMLMTSDTRHTVHEAWPGWWTASPSASGGEPDAILLLRWKGLVSVRALAGSDADAFSSVASGWVRHAFSSPHDPASDLVRRLLEPS